MHLLVVTGMSGAGKTQALRKLEDLGYFCVDNLPSEMLSGFVALCERVVPPVDRAAVVIDSRVNVFKYDLVRALDLLEKKVESCSVIFFDCRDEVLERRYNETRRRHPISSEIRKGIAGERELLSDIRDRANHIIDTTALKPMELNRELERILNISNDAFSLTVMSFGYKRGVPFEADAVLDMRFSPNPFYEENLRCLSGLDKPIQDFVFQDEDVRALLDYTEKMLTKLIPRFQEQDKHRLLVAFGCTGGRHRSVCAAEELFRRMKDKVSSVVIHRDLVTEGTDITDRTGGVKK